MTGTKPEIHLCRRPMSRCLCLASIMLLAACNLGTKPYMPPPQPTAGADWQLRWLRGVPCRPPCWEGVIPGQTSIVSATALLRSNPIVDAGSVDSLSGIGGNQAAVSWNWADKTLGGSLLYNWRDRQQMVQVIDPVLPYYRLGDVVHAYGEPSDIAAFVLPYPDGPTAYRIRLIYRSLGLALASENYSRPELNGDLLVQVRFFAPSDDGPEAVWYGNTPPQAFVKWEGYKTFEYYCRGAGKGAGC